MKIYEIPIKFGRIYENLRKLLQSLMLHWKNIESTTAKIFAKTRINLWKTFENIFQKQ